MKIIVYRVAGKFSIVLLGGCGSSNASDASSSAANSSEKQVMEENIDFWSFWGSGARKKLSKKSLRISINHKTRSM